MIVSALASLHRIASDVNGMSAAIEDVNRRQSHFEAVLRAGGRSAVPKVECVNANPMAITTNKMSYMVSQTDILGNNQKCLSVSKTGAYKTASFGFL